VNVGAIEVLNPATMKSIPYDELVEVAKSFLEPGVELDTSVRVPQDPVPGSERAENMASSEAQKKGYYVPTLEEVMAQGYDEEGAREIIAEHETNKADEEAQAEEDANRAEAFKAEAARAEAEKEEAARAEAEAEEEKARAEAEAKAAIQAREEELDAMTRPVLDKMAKKSGIKKPDKLPNKSAVIEAIMNAEGGE